MPIRVLPPLLINQIAAGEVIERPASVVKELVENSLDAHATRIDIAIEDGGRQLIRISDDGIGIPPEELVLAVTAHATSKLHQAEQLESIGTLGFRGEALASIASVSRLKITSRHTLDGTPAEAASTLECSGEQLSDVMPASGSPGTVIEIRDLFFNTPARRKFLRGAPVEFGHIAETVHRIAMVWPGVGFSLMHNGRKVIEVPANQTRRQRCVDLMGSELDEALLEFEQITPDAEGAIKAWGLAGKPAIARATAKFQYLCLNGRPIKDRGLAHAIKESYRGLIPPDQQPVAVVMIDMPATLVDVNVHPAKSEVRFRDGSRMHGVVLSALRQRLLGADLTPSAKIAFGGANIGKPAWTPPGNEDFSASPAAATTTPAAPVNPWSLQPPPVTTPVLPELSGLGEANYSSVSPSSGVATSANVTANSPAISPSPATPSHPPAADPSLRSFVDYFRRMAPQQKGFVFEEVKKALADENPNALLEDGNAGSASPISGDSAARPVSKPVTILQVHDSYVVTQDEQGLLIIDQHALHERVMFEELRRKVAEKNLESQRLLMPATVPASPQRQALLDPLQPLLKRIGIEAEPLGPRTIGVQAFASMLFDRGVDPVEFMTELLDLAEEGKLEGSDANAQEAALHEVLDMMSCKAAVKAGQTMSHAELQALLNKREEIERASNCPHGRPTTIRMSLRDLEKQFKRV